MNIQSVNLLEFDIESNYNSIINIIEQTNQINQTDQIDQINQINQTDQTDQINQINQTDPLNEYNQAKNEFENYEKELYNYYTIDMINDIKLNFNLYLESKIKAHKEYANYYQKYLEKKDKYDEYIRTQIFIDTNNYSDFNSNTKLNLNLIKNYIDNKIKSSVSNFVDYEYKLIEISNKLNKYAIKYDLYIFTCIMPLISYEIAKGCMGNEFTFFVDDKFKFEMIKKIIPQNFFKKMLSGESVQHIYTSSTHGGISSETMDSSCKLKFCYYDEIKNKINENIDEKIKNKNMNCQQCDYWSIIDGRLKCDFLEYYGPLYECGRNELHDFNWCVKTPNSINKLYKTIYNILAKIYENILFYEKNNFDLVFFRDLTKKMIIYHDIYGTKGKISVYDYYKQNNYDIKI